MKKWLVGAVFVLTAVLSGCASYTAPAGSSVALLAQPQQGEGTFVIFRRSQFGAFEATPMAVATSKGEVSFVGSVRSKQALVAKVPAGQTLFVVGSYRGQNALSVDVKPGHIYVAEVILNKSTDGSTYTLVPRPVDTRTLRNLARSRATQNNARGIEEFQAEMIAKTEQALQGHTVLPTVSFPEQYAVTYDALLQGYQRLKLKY